MSHKTKILVLLILVAGVATGGLYAGKTSFASDNHAAAGHDEGGEHDDHKEDGERADKTTINNEAATAMQIETLDAGPASIHQTIGLTGKITLNQHKTAQIRARFPGMVKTVSKSVGDKVVVGEVLATVESNDSLQVYAVKAPYDGTVIERNANPGDMAESEPMFVVADLSQMWAEFFIFSRDMDRVRTGQKIDVKSLSEDNSTEATITSLLPLAESSSQTVIARVTIDNGDGKWRSGMIVRGDVVLNEKAVPVAVKTESIQRQEGAPVVYVKNGETYEAHRIQTGMTDREWTEIISGLEASQTYVANNSFVVKADIGKAAADHEH